MSALDARLTGIRRPGADRKLTPDREASLIADWRSNLKLRELSEKYEISKFTVYAILDRHGIGRNKKTPPSEQG